MIVSFNLYLSTAQTYLPHLIRVKSRLKNSARGLTLDAPDVLTPYIFPTSQKGVGCRITELTKRFLISLVEVHSSSVLYL